MSDGARRTHGRAHSVLARICGAVALGALTVACAPEVRTHGYTPSEDELGQILVGQDTRGSVQRKIGRPAGAGIFTDEGWYYVSSRVEHLMYYDPEVVDRKVLAILFDPNDVVVAVNRYGLEDGRVIDLETGVTPTYGRELTIIEQALGNIGVITGDVFEN